MVRKAKESDLPRIAEIQKVSWHAAYTSILPKNILEQNDINSFLALWETRFRDANQDDNLVVYETDNQVVGFSRTCNPGQSHCSPAGYGELSHLYIDPQQTSKGIGYQLFEFANNHLKIMNYKGLLLWTLEHNKTARRFYEKQGMTTDGGLRDDPIELGDGIREVRYLLPFDASSYNEI